MCEEQPERTAHSGSDFHAHFWAELTEGAAGRWAAASPVAFLSLIPILPKWMCVGISLKSANSPSNFRLLSVTETLISLLLERGSDSQWTHTSWEDL